MENKKDELLEEEVNVYGWWETCSQIKVHCMYDCFGTNDAWLSTSN